MREQITAFVRGVEALTDEWDVQPLVIQVLPTDDGRYVVAPVELPWEMADSPADLLEWIADRVVGDPDYPGLPSAEGLGSAVALLFRHEGWSLSSMTVDPDEAVAWAESRRVVDHPKAVEIRAVVGIDVEDRTYMILRERNQPVGGVDVVDYQVEQHGRVIESLRTILARG